MQNTLRPSFVEHKYGLFSLKSSQNFFDAINIFVDSFAFVLTFRPPLLFRRAETYATTIRKRVLDYCVGFLDCSHIQISRPRGYVVSQCSYRSGPKKIPLFEINNCQYFWWHCYWYIWIRSWWDKELNTAQKHWMSWSHPMFLSVWALFMSLLSQIPKTWSSSRQVLLLLKTENLERVPPLYSISRQPHFSSFMHAFICAGKSMSFFIFVQPHWESTYSLTPPLYAHDGALIQAYLGELWEVWSSSPSAFAFRNDQALRLFPSRLNVHVTDPTLRKAGLQSLTFLSFYLCFK